MNLYSVNCISCHSMYHTVRLKHATKCVRCGSEFGGEDKKIIIYIGSTKGADKGIVLEAYTHPVTLGKYLRKRKEKKENGSKKEIKSDQ